VIVDTDETERKTPDEVFSKVVLWCWCQLKFVSLWDVESGSTERLDPVLEYRLVVVVLQHDRDKLEYFQCYSLVMMTLLLLLLLLLLTLQHVVCAKLLNFFDATHWK
jgi:hypothetical protein